jgi:DHA1 family tetracycline resistance protein-like MFS transporter
MSTAAEPSAPGGNRLDQGSLFTLLAGNVLLELGVGFFFPILPIFLSRRGGSAAFIGAVIASGVVAKAIAQYPGGRLADRYGRRPVLVLSLGLYSASFVGFLVPMPLVGFFGLRFIQALTIGAYIPAASAAIADLTPPERRGWAYGQMRATEMAGLLLGPVVGGLVAGLELNAVFAAAAALCTVGTVLLLRLPRVQSSVAAGAAPPRPSRELLRRLLPAMVIGSAIYYTIGTYDAVWSLYMVSRGGTLFQVGLSFAIYALPVLVVSSLLAGWADRLGFKRAGGMALVAYGLFNALYPLLVNPWLLIGSGFVEGAATALASPALSAEVSRHAPPGGQATTQGVYSTILNVSLAAGSLIGGPLFVLGPRPAFWASSMACILALAVTAAWNPFSRRR